MLSEKYSMFSWDSMRYTVNINKGRETRKEERRYSL